MTTNVKKKFKFFWSELSNSHVSNRAEKLSKVNTGSEPEAHDKVFDNNPDQDGNWKSCWFLRRGENLSTWRKTSQRKDENQQQTQPTYMVPLRSGTLATLVRGECSRHCIIPAKQENQHIPFCSLSSNRIGQQRTATEAF